MRDKKRIVGVDTYMPVLCELLAQGKEVSLTITGNSMAPFMAHGRDEILISPPDGCWKKGDMAFFRRINGQYVMHRICRVDGEGNCFFVGDAQQIIEGPVRPEQIFGKITKVNRKGKWIGPGDFWWEFFEHVWINIIPLRPACWKIYRILWKIRKKSAIL